MKTITDFTFQNEKVLVRVDYNVPLNDQLQVSDDTRIRASLPTLRHLLEKGASLILMSHLGRPKGGPEPKFSLRPVIPVLENLLGKKIFFAENCIGESAYSLSRNLKPGEILLLENLRFYKEEEKGDEEFARKLAQHGTFYVNDAFGTAHRAHASTAVIAKFFPSGKKCAGLLMYEEVNNLNKVLQNPRRPFTAIVGGAKVSDKILILKSLIQKADAVIIGGGMAFTFIKANGGKIGKSLCEDERLQEVDEICKTAKQRGVKLLLPSDVLAHTAFEDVPGKPFPIHAIPDEYMGLDIGQESIQQFRAQIKASGTLLWNGPMGVFEFKNYCEGTRQVGLALAEATESGAFSLVGGGDSVAAVMQLGLKDKVSYISTGGGAMLEFVEQGTLPGVVALQ